MPKLKKSYAQQVAERVQLNIELIAKERGVEVAADIGNRIGVKVATFYNRRKNPKKWRLEELAHAAETFKVPVSWLVSEHEIGKEAAQAEAAKKTKETPAE